MEKVLVEYIDEENPEKVAVYLFDEDIKGITGDVIEVMDRGEVDDNYHVVGLISEDGIDLFEEDEDFDDVDYYDEFGISDEDEDE